MIDGFIALYIFMLAAFTGYEVIARVPVILHTPLMSGSNFVHGIVLVGAMVAMGRADTPLELDDRVHRRRARGRQRRRRLRRHRAHARDVQEQQGQTLMGSIRRPRLIQASYFVAAALFILGLKRMSSPVTARSGIVWAGVGMVVATLITFLTPGMDNYALMTVAIAVGGIAAWVTGQRVAMTDMPQMIALYNGMGGGAAGAIAAVELFAGEAHGAARAHARRARRHHRRRVVLGQPDRVRQAPGAHQAQLPVPRPELREHR